MRAIWGGRANGIGFKEDLSLGRSVSVRERLGGNIGYM